MKNYKIYQTMNWPNLFRSKPFVQTFEGNNMDGKLVTALLLHKADGDKTWGTLNQVEFWLDNHGQALKALNYLLLQREGWARVYPNGKFKIATRDRERVPQPVDDAALRELHNRRIRKEDDRLFRRLLGVHMHDGSYVR